MTLETTNALSAPLSAGLLLLVAWAAAGAIVAFGIGRFIRRANERSRAAMELERRRHGRQNTNSR